MAYINHDVSTMAMPSGMNRMGQFPLDMSSVYYDKASLNAYAESGSIAYVGQIVSLVDEANNKVTVYSIQDKAGNLKEVGTVPTGDKKTIEVDAEGKISLANIESLVFKRDILGEDGQPTGEKEDIQYQALLTEDGLVWVEPSKTTVEGLATLLDALTKRVDTLEGKVGKASDGEGTDATGLFANVENLDSRLKAVEGSYIEDSIFYPVKDNVDAIMEILPTETVEGSNVLQPVYSEAEVNALIQDAKDYADENEITYTLGYESKVEGEDGHPARIVLTPSEGEATYVDATPFIKDGMLDNVSYDAESNTLTFTFNTDAGKEDVEVELTDILAPYIGKDGERIKVEVDGNEISADLKVGTISKEYLDTGVQASLNKADTALQEEALADYATKVELEAVEERAAADATTKANTAKTEAIADADAKLANKANTADVYTKSEADKKIEDALKDATGGESASDVLLALNNFKAAIKTEVWGSEVDDDAMTGTSSRIDALEAVGAQKNVIENVIGKDTNRLTISAIENKTITIDDTNLRIDIAAAQSKADEASAAASTNAASIQTLGTNLDTANSKITALETASTDHGTRLTTAEGKISTLEGTVASHTESITSLNGAVAAKAEQSALDAAVVDIAKNTSAITTLNETTIPGINGEVAKKANSADVYTKTEIGAIEEGKTLVEMITAAGDTAALEARVKANEDAIAAIPNTYVDNDELAAAIKVETDRADAEEKRLAGLISDNATAIAGNTAVINSILGNEDETDLNSIAELADWINTHGAEATTMSEAIQKNADDIADIQEAIKDVEAGAEINAIETISLGDEAALAIDENRNVKIPVALQATLGVVKSSAAATYNEDTGIYSGENKIMVDTDGTMEVNALNINKLVQNKGDQLILSGGTATIEE